MIEPLQTKEIVAIVAVVATFSVPVLIVAMAFTFKAYTLKLKHKAAALDGPVLQRFDELAARITRIEQRLANLETIVLESEKKREFDRAL